ADARNRCDVPRSRLFVGASVRGGGAAACDHGSWTSRSASPRVEIYSGRACGRRADSLVLPIPVSRRVPNLSTAGPVSNGNLDTFRGNRIRRGSGSTLASTVSECPPDKIAWVARVGAGSRCRRSGGTLLRENSPTGGGWPGAILCRIRHPVV